MLLNDCNELRSRSRDPRKNETVPSSKRKRRPISRVLSWATIHLGRMSPCASSNLPESHADHVIRFLFGLAPSGVYLADSVTRSRGALLPHHFTLTALLGVQQRCIFCCTFREFALPRSYLALCPTEPGLSSGLYGPAIAWPSLNTCYEISVAAKKTSGLEFGST